MYKTKNTIGVSPQFIFRHSSKIILFAAILTLVSVYFVRGLGLKTEISDLLPTTYQSVKTLNEIKARVGGVGSLIVGVEGAAYDKLQQAITLLANEIPKSKLVKNVEYQRDDSFVDDNVLIFAKLHQLQALEKEIKERIEDEKLKLGGLYDDFFADDDEEAESLGHKFRREKETFFTNEEKSMVAMKVYPAGTATNLNFVRKLFAEIRSIVEQSDLASISPSIQVLYGGSFKSSIDQNDTILSDIRLNLFTTVPAIILFVSLYFRQPGGFAFIFLPLAMSICWTFCLTEIIYDDLNAITAFLFMILFGLGIDYGIHLFARYLEARRKVSIKDALEQTLAKTGRGIFTSALTTSVAFFTLMINDFKGFSQFGFICGIGIVNAYLAMTIVFPAFLVVFDRLGWIRIISPKFHPSKISGKFKGTKAIIATSGVLTLLGLGVLAYSVATKNGVQFEYDFKSLRANIKKSNEIAERLSSVFDDEATSPAIVLSESREQTRAIAAYLQGKPTVKSVLTVETVVPDSQAEKMSVLSRIDSLVHTDESDLVQGQDHEDLLELRRLLAKRKRIAVEDMPDKLLAPFFGKNGQLGEFAFILPAVKLRDGRQAIRFAREVHEINLESGETLYASSPNIVIADMLQVLLRESKLAISLTLLAVFFLVFFDVRDLKSTLLILTPLLAAILWLVLVMFVFRIKLNFFNMVVLPSIVGIGIDNGVHIFHRYREEGRGSVLVVLRNTGLPVLASVLTTMLGFIGLVFAQHQGLSSIGKLAVMGLSLTLVTAVTLLPALLQAIEDRLDEQS